MQTLPLGLLNFLFVQSFQFFARLWQNVILTLDEDMSVRIMARLIFTPMFHDSSIFGRILSFFFRISRIIFGVFAMFLATVIICLMAFLWFAAPFLLILSLILPALSDIAMIAALLILLQIALFIHHVINRPLLAIKHIKEPEDLWKATKLNPAQINWSYLIQTDEVKEYLKLMELTPQNFGNLNILDSDSLNKQALILAQETNARFVTASHFWLAMLLNIPYIENELLKLDRKMEDFKGALKFQELKRNKWRHILVWDEEYKVNELAGVNRGWMGVPTPALNSVSTDLTREAADSGFDDFIGRQYILDEVVAVLSQDKSRNVILVGAAGAGKSTLVKSLAQRIMSGNAPASLANKRLIELDLTKLLSAVHSEGDLAQKIKDVFEEVQYVEDVIVYVDEIHNLGLGEAGANLNLYSLMLPYLESDKFQFLASTEPENYSRILEKNGSLVRLFHKIDVDPASKEDTIAILEEKSIEGSKKSQVEMSYIAIVELVSKAQRLIHDRVLPDSALSVYEECFTAAKGLIDKKTHQGGYITLKLVDEILSKRVNVPLLEVDHNQKDLLLHLEAIIHQKMIDQEQAVKAVSNTLRRSATSLREENRPIGTFLFVGPTGVGKTELAKTLAEVYFKTSNAFVRFDMSEYQTPEAVNRLIGTTTIPGELTETIENKPYALLLLDEFEKANPQILNLFLQVLDDGRLTDASGKTVDFTNTIIIATSNAASLTIAQGISKGVAIDEIEVQVREELLKVYRPELVNRFDSVVIFKPLSMEDLSKIVNFKLTDLKKLLKNQGYLVEFTPGLTAMLAKKGFDPVLGARPLRRLIQDTLESKLSIWMLEGKIQKGMPFKADVDLME